MISQSEAFDADQYMHNGSFAIMAQQRKDGSVVAVSNFRLLRDGVSEEDAFLDHLPFGDGQRIIEVPSGIAMMTYEDVSGRFIDFDENGDICGFGEHAPKFPQPDGDLERLHRTLRKIIGDGTTKILFDVENEITKFRMGR